MNDKLDQIKVNSNKNKTQKTIFKNRNFMLLWIGQLVSKIGDNILEFALSWYIYDITGSTTALSISIISFFIPQACISTCSGIIADKYDRKKIIIVCDILNSLMIFILFSISLQRELSLTIIVVFNILISSISAMFSPAMSGAIQSVLDKKELQDAGALTQMQGRFAIVVGSALGGWMLKVVGIQWLLLFNGISFLISAISESFIELQIVKESKVKTSMIDSLKEGFEFLAKNRIILFLTLFAGIIANGMFMSVAIYMPAIFKDVLGKTSLELGIYFSIEGIVATLTSMYFVFSKIKLNPYKWTFISLLIQGFVLVGIGTMNNLKIAYFISALAGFGFTICSITTSTLIRELTPNNIMGRLGSLNMFVGSLAMPVFTIIFGILGESANLQTIIINASIIFFVSLTPAPFIFSKQSKII